MDAIQLTRSSGLLCKLMRFLPMILDKLESDAAWTCYHATDPETRANYLRLQCHDRLRSSSSGVGYLVGVHAFDRADTQTAWHDHRSPIAVFPYCPSGTVGSLLYHMPWEHRRDGAVVRSGILDVRSGAPYAIETPRTVFHAVHGVAPHLSVVLADTSMSATRAERMATAAADEAQSHRVRTAAAHALRKMLAPAQQVHRRFARS